MTSSASPLSAAPPEPPCGSTLRDWHRSITTFHDLLTREVTPRWDISAKSTAAILKDADLVAWTAAQKRFAAFDPNGSKSWPKLISAAALVSALHDAKTIDKADLRNRVRLARRRRRLFDLIHLDTLNATRPAGRRSLQRHAATDFRQVETEHVFYIFAARHSEPALAAMDHCGVSPANFLRVLAGDRVPATLRSAIVDLSLLARRIEQASRATRATLTVSARQASPRKLRACVELALASLNECISERPGLSMDAKPHRQVRRLQHDWIRNHGTVYSGHTPEFRTWSRYIREALARPQEPRDGTGTVHGIDEI
ncbi:MAG: hypothetical protein IPH13_06025 [Planctomycetes bacterium]|nr:hypothetical protein [Planctomycetota bacterium]